MDLATENSRERKRTTHYADIDEANRHVLSQIENQKALNLSDKEKAEVMARVASVGPNVNLQNARDPAVGRLYSGLNENQRSWMKHEFEKRKYMAQRQAAMNAMNAVGQLPKPDYSSEEELQKRIDAENAKMTKGDTYNNNITVYNSISADSEMTAKIIKEQLRFFATSQLNFTSRTAAAKAFAL